MKRALLLILLLSACQEETASLPAAVPLTQESVGHYCQMNLFEHPGPKAQVHLDGLPGAPLYFSQVRDAVAYARMPEQSHAILAIYVNDMGVAGATWDEPGAANWIPAGSALYVVGSRRTGGMGAPELVPFADRARADAFAAAEGGRVLALADIPDSDVLAPVDGAADAGDADYKERLRKLGEQAGG